MIVRGGNAVKCKIIKMTYFGNSYLAGSPFGIKWCLIDRGRFLEFRISIPNDSLVTSLNNIAQSELSGLALWNMRNEIEKNQEISEKPFPCDFCDSRFKRLYDKNRHMKMAHLAHLEQTDQGEM